MTDTQEVLASTVFIPPSVADNLDQLLAGRSYAHYSSTPAEIKTTNSSENEPATQCVLGVDEAGRGPVIGPMIYGVYYLPIQVQKSLLADKHHFDDSKVLTPAVRARLMQEVCTPGSDLYDCCGWAVKSLSAQDIGAGMLKNGGSYNLNAQAMDATIEIIRGVIERGVNVREIYVDTIGQPAVYQKKLEKIFPTIKITVEKKADSLYPCVSAASVVAKVTRDVSCEMLYDGYVKQIQNQQEDESGWGSGYPSDAKCVSWLKRSIDPVFGWGNECRFSWGTVKDMLEANGGPAIKAEFPDDAGGDENMRVSHFFTTGLHSNKTENDELRDWFGVRVGQEIF